jgi:hypothetical protein
MQRRFLVRCFLTLGASLLLFSGGSAAQSFNFATIDVPCSACPGGIARQTVASGVNPSGDVVGVYADNVGGSHGFLLSAGQYTTIDVPGSLVGATGTLPTSANGINPAGDIVGSFTAPVNASAPPDSAAYCPAAGSAACIKGFLYRHGKFSAVLFPGHPGAVPQRITPDGDIYGCLHDFDLMSSMFGAVWTRSGNASLTANGGELNDASMSMPMSMNNGATPGGHMIVGFWSDMVTGRRHGFVVQDGVFQSYDVPGSTVTLTWDANPRQQFVGTYVSSGVRHGFLQNPDDSAPINIDFPGAAATVAFGINPDGVIVGQYLASGHVHGFVAVPATAN